MTHRHGIDSVVYCCPIFARAGFTDAARSLAQDHGALLTDLDRLDRDLQTYATSGSMVSDRST